MSKEIEATKNALQERNRELEELNERLRSVVTSFKGFAACSRMHEIVPLLLEEFARNMDVRGGSLYLKEEKRLVRKHALDPHHAPEFIELPLKKGSIFEMAMKQGTPVMINDIGKETVVCQSGWDGYRDGSLLVFPLPDDTGDIIGLISLHNKVNPPFTFQDQELGTILASFSSEKLRAAKAVEDLAESERRYRLIAENASDVIWIVGADMRFTYISPSAKRLLGYTSEDLINRDATTVLTPESLTVAMSTLEEELALETDPMMSRTSRVLDLEIIGKDGSTIWTESRTTFIRNEKRDVIGVMGVSRDIKQKRDLEIQLRQAQKMEAIGTLAGGIAHDFNNMLSAIIGFTEVAGLQIDADHSARKHLDRVLAAGERAKDLVNQILSFSRQTDYERKPVQLDLIVKEALKLLRSSLPSTIEMRVNIEAEGEVVEADATQMHQIIMNLGSNAKDAMVGSGGVLEVNLTAVELKEKRMFPFSDLTPGTYLKLTVSDTGSGMDRPTMERIFEPYFTTKAKEEGTGLGMAVVHGIVKSHGGDITVESELERGTAFHIYLPVVGDKPVLEESRIEEDLPSGSEHIIFIDDEPAIAEMGKEMLTLLGYETTTFTSSLEALEAFRAEPDRFDLVITDMTMPKMTGDRLAREFLQIRPDIPLIICTGYSDMMNEKKAKQIGIRDFIRKPLAIRDLAVVVRRLLG